LTLGDLIQETLELFEQTGGEVQLFISEVSIIVVIMGFIFENRTHSLTLNT